MEALARLEAAVTKARLALTGNLDDMSTIMAAAEHAAYDVNNDMILINNAICERVKTQIRILDERKSKSYTILLFEHNGVAIIQFIDTSWTLVDLRQHIAHIFNIKLTDNKLVLTQGE